MRNRSRTSSTEIGSTTVGGQVRIDNRKGTDSVTVMGSDIASSLSVNNKNKDSATVIDATTTDVTFR